MRKQKKRVTAGFLAALVGVTGFAGYHLQNVQAYTFAQSNGEMTYSDEGSAWETGEADAEGKADSTTAIAMESTGDFLEEDDVYFYFGEENELLQTIGVNWNEKKDCYVYDGERIAAMWIEDGSFTTFGDEENDGICLYISKEKKDNQVILEAHKMSPEEFEKFYNENNEDGNRISVSRS